MFLRVRVVIHVRMIAQREALEGCLDGGSRSRFRDT